MIRKTIKGDFQVSDAHWANVSHHAVDLVTKMLEKDPEKRIDLLHAMMHPFITDRQSLRKYKDVNRVEEVMSDEAILRAEHIDIS